MIRVADYIVERIAEAGVGHVFMITGRGILYLSDAVAKNEKIQAVAVHHEQAAAFAANAYAQYNDTLGCCIISTGCASTNALTGVLNAWQDGEPLIVVSGQNKRAETVQFTGKHIRTFGSQEADIVPVVSPITKYAKTVLDPQEIGKVMDEALWAAMHGVKGPVWVDVPVDVQNMRVEADELPRWEDAARLDATHLEPKALDVSEVVKDLKKAERPVVLIGSGVRAAGAIEDLMEFVEKNRIPVVYSASAVDTYGAAHELSIGTVGAIGCNRAANFTIQNADLVLSIGCRLSPMLTGSEYHKFARAAKLIVVDIDDEEHKKDTVHIDEYIHSDAKAFLREILLRLDATHLAGRWNEWVEKCKHWKVIFPKAEDGFKQGEKIDLYEIVEALGKVLPDDAVVLSDAGMEELLVPTVIEFKDGQRMLHPASQGCMGVALPASIGAYYSCGHEVVAVIGDGSVMMNLQELQTIAAQQIPAKIIIVNNGIYAVIRKRQKELFRTRTVGTDVSNGVTTPDFMKIAECFGIAFMRIEEKGKMDEGLKELMKTKGPVICEIMATEEQDYIRSGAAFNSQRKFVNRPLEDQMPFLPREVIEREMIIEPIDM